MRNIPEKGLLSVEIKKSASDPSGRQFGDDRCVDLLAQAAAA